MNGGWVVFLGSSKVNSATPLPLPADSHFPLPRFLARIYKKNMKGIVQLDLKGIKTRLKRSVLINYLVANVFYFDFIGTTLSER